MARLLWDKPGDRRYETGVDRGVLYLSDGTGVPWNGLVFVEEDLSSISMDEHFFDGIKYLDTRYPGDFSATIRAFTYPDEFLEFDGYTELNNSVLLGHQPVYNRFGLTYRTKIGNDVLGEDAGYKIHILYNLVAIPENRSYGTMDAQANPTDLSWRVTGVPEPVAGHRPTSHIILDTTRLNPYLVRDIENLLYGTDPYIPPSNIFDGGAPLDGTGQLVVDGGSVSDPGVVTLDGGPPLLPTEVEVVDSGDISTVEPGASDDLDGGTPFTSGETIFDGGAAVTPTGDSGLPQELQAHLPPLTDIVNLLNEWVLIEITDHGDGTWSAEGPDDFVRMLDETTFEIVTDSAVYIDPDTYQISTTHTF